MAKRSSLALTVVFLGSFALLMLACKPPPVGSPSGGGGTTSPGTFLLGTGGSAVTSSGTGGSVVVIDTDASVFNGQGGSGGGGGGGTPTADANCGITSVSTTKQPAELLLVLDRSNSMAWDITQDKDCASGSSCTTRWKAVTDAVAAVLPDTQDSVYWGLKLFATSSNGCDVTDGVDVAPAANNASAVSAAIAATGPSTGTPTTLVIQKAAAYLRGLSDSNPKYILLATDGEPYCGGRNQDQPDDQNAINSIKNNAFANGIKVFVVGLAISSSTADTLNKMADAGGTSQFYAASSPDALKSALQNISGIVANCDFALSKKPPDPNNIAVYLDGNRLPNDNSNGWILTDNNNKVEITGSYCDAIKNGTGKDIQVLMGCAPIPIGVIP